MAGEPLRYIKDLHDHGIRDTLVQKLAVFNVEDLGEIATAVTEQKCPSCNSEELLQILAEYKIRFLFRELKKRDKGLAKWLRETLPAGSTANDDWKVIADKIKLTSSKIKAIDRRETNPAGYVLSTYASTLSKSVGDFYDFLVDCGFGAIADDL